MDNPPMPAHARDPEDLETISLDELNVGTEGPRFNLDVCEGAHCELIHGVHVATWTVVPFEDTP